MVNSGGVAIVAGTLLFLVRLQAADAITREHGDQILDELRQIRQILEKQAVPPMVGRQAPGGLTKMKLHLDGMYSIGSKEAEFVIVEYTDYECPFCRRFHATTFGELKNNYIDTGKLEFYSRDLPLKNHRYAMQAAEAARCANEQGAFWTMRDRMAPTGSGLDITSLIDSAQALSLDLSAFIKCITSAKYKSSIQQDMREAADIGANATPTFLVGRRTPDGLEGELVTGAMPYQIFDDKLRSLGAK